MGQKKRSRKKFLEDKGFVCDNSRQWSFCHKYDCRGGGTFVNPLDSSHNKPPRLLKKQFLGKRKAKAIAIATLAIITTISPMTAQAIDVKQTWQKTKQKSTQMYNASMNTVLPFISQTDILRWTEGITKSAATKFDKALDAKYLQNAIGGGNHRLYDGGHTLQGAYDNVTNMCAMTGCTTTEKWNGLMGALWKDITTPKGLPFFNMNKITYDNMANWLTNTIPGTNKAWVYDMLSFDALEIVSSTMSIVGVIFLLNKNDMEKLSMLLGNIGVVSVASANPLLAIVGIVTIAYAIFKGKQLNWKQGLKGFGGASIALIMFHTLPFPLLLTFVMVIAVETIYNKYTTKENIHIVKDWIKANIKEELLLMEDVK